MFILKTIIRGGLVEKDDLFDDYYIEKKEETIIRYNQEEDSRSVGKINLIILSVYVVFLFISSLFAGIIQQNHLDETAGTLEFDLVSTFTKIVDDEGYILNYQGDITNTTSEEVLHAYIVFELTDSDGNIVATKNYKIENLGPNETININEDYTIDEYASVFITREYHPMEPQIINLLNFIPTLIIAFVLFYVNRKNFKENFIVFKKAPKRHFTYILLGFVLAYASLIVANVIMDLIGVSGTSQNELAIQSMFSKDIISMVSLFLLLVIFTPIVEETVFRKSIYGLVRPSLGDKGAIIISGLIFGLLHVVGHGDFIQIIPYAFMGLSFSYIYYHSNRNIYVVIAIHALNNLIPYLIYTSELFI